MHKEAIKIGKSTPNLKKNFLFNVTYQLISIFTPLITAPYLSRVLGAEGIGIQSYTASIQFYFSLIAALGTTTYGERAIAQARDDLNKRSKLFWEIETLTLFTSFLSILMWLIVCIYGQYHIIYTILSINIIATALDITWFFSGLEQFPTIVTRNLIIRVLSIVLIFSFIRSKNDLIKYIIINSTTTLIACISLWGYLKKYIILIPIRDLNIFRHFLPCISYFIPTIAISVYTVLDKSLIGIITKEATQNGYYEQAEKIIGLLKTLIYATINTVVGPRASYLVSMEEEDTLRQLVIYSMNYIFFVGIGAIFGIYAIASRAVPIFFGKGYDEVVILLYLLSPIALIIGISNCLGTQYYTPKGLRPKTTKYIIAGAVTNLILNITLIPKYGARGAAVASVIAECVVTILYFLQMKGFIKIATILQIFPKKFICGLLMFVSVYKIGVLVSRIYPALITIVIQTLSGTIIYILGLTLIRDAFTLKIIKQCRSVVQNKMTHRKTKSCASDYKNDNYK